MDNYNDKEIFCLSYNLLIKYGLYTFPINVEGLIKDIGINLVKVNSEEMSIKRGYNIEIAYTPSGDDATDRFNLAMGLGFMLMNCYSIKDEGAILSAEAFALRLLMPSSVILHNRLRVREEVAEYFGVSKYTAEEALKKVYKSNILLEDKLENEYYMRYCIHNNCKPIKLF